MTLRPEAQRWLAHESDPRLCEAELDKVRRGCSPACFDCSCGRRWVHFCDEAEGCSWVAVEGRQPVTVSDEFVSFSERQRRREVKAQGERLDQDNRERQRQRRLDLAERQRQRRLDLAERQASVERLRDLADRYSAPPEITDDDIPHGF